MASFARLAQMTYQARAINAFNINAKTTVRTFISSAPVAGPRSLAMPMASAARPTKLEMAEHYSKFLDVYENDKLVSSNSAIPRSVTHYPIEEVLEAAPVVASEATSETTYSTAGNSVYFVDGRQGMPALA